jgi:uncharacterized protein
MSDTVIQMRQALRQHIGEPWDGARNKQLSALDTHCENIIRAAPLVMLATSNKIGQCDVSPRGDARGFVQIENAHTLLLPERPGNLRADSLCNILENPHVGLLFMIPGMSETLRVNGTASILCEQQLLQRFVVNGKAPKLVVRIGIEEVFLHCGKALIRANLWNPEAWSKPKPIASAGEVFRDHMRLEISTEQAQGILDEDYKNGLY